MTFVAGSVLSADLVTSPARARTLGGSRLNIEFSDFGIDDASVLGFTAKDEQRESLLTFVMPERFMPAGDLIGLAISTMAGKKYDDIAIDLPLSPPHIQRVIGEVCDANVTAPVAEGGALPVAGGHNGSLNFSGGFDSLAALMTLPKDTRLISLDFGGNFQRETDYFQRFHPTTLKTNFRTEGFANNSWSFMGIGSILLRDYLEIDTYGFGSIIEASPWNVRQTRPSNNPHRWYGEAELKQLNPVQGLTEVGTVMLLAEHCPEQIRDSLVSLAGPGSEKLNRKIVLLNIVADRFDYRLRGEMDRAVPHFNFGKSFATDFLILYIIKNGGVGLARQLVGKIPEEVVSFVTQHRLDFYERVNPSFYEDVPLASKRLIYEKCLQAGIVPYTENDWADYRSVARLLSAWHDGIA